MEWSDTKDRNVASNSSLGTVTNGKVILPSAYGISAKRDFQNSSQRIPQSQGKSVGYLISHQSRPVGPSLPKIVVLQDRKRIINQANGPVIRKLDSESENAKK